MNMIKNKLIKEKISRISIILSALLYIIIAFDYLENGHYWFFIGIGLIGIVNLFLLKLKNADTNVFGFIVNSLNFLAAGLITINQYQIDGRIFLWSAITFAYFFVAFVFIKKKFVNK